MSFRDDLVAMTPRLRRYARALCAVGASQGDAGDDIVQATLIRALEPGAMGRFDLVTRLYAMVTEAHRATVKSDRYGATAAGGHGAHGAEPARDHRERPASDDAVIRGLAAMTLEEREVFLLVAAEGFSYGQAARILRISRVVLLARLVRARAGLDAALAPRLEGTRPAGRRISHLRLVK